MGKKKYNAKARLNPETIVDNSAVKSIKIDGVDDVHSNGSIPTGYDEANALALPSKKRATKIKVEKRKVVKILTKKQRKNLQSIVDKKKKKEGREQLLKDLAAVQISETELNQYTSVSQAQTVGLKRLPKLDDYLAKKKERQAQQQIEKDQNKSGVQRVNALKGSKRKLLVEEQEDLEAKRINPNIINAEESEDEESEDEESEDEESEDEESEDKESEDKESEDDDDDTDTSQEEEEEYPDKLLTIESPTGPAASSTPIHTYEQKQPFTNEKVAPKIQPALLTLNPIPVHVPVNRTAKVQAARLRLPILAEEQQVMELINDNPIVIVAGETGSGKTTQIPQFLYEAGYARDKMIGITEPRRVAAISMSKRVAYEMNLPSSEVSYLVRFEGNVTPDTRIKFMTDGVLLKEIETDFLLNKYSVIVLDEAHERTMNTDILIGLLSRIVPLRSRREHKLKLIIMSATLRVSDFTENKNLFHVAPPVIKVEARQYPVTIHFQKHTPEDYVAEAFRKTLKIHSKLPDGGILIFVTGQQEVLQLVRKLRKAFPYQKQEQPVQQEHEQEQQSEMQQEEELEEQFDSKRPKQKSRKKKDKLPKNISLPKINLDDYKLAGEDTDADMYEQLSLQVITSMKPGIHDEEEDKLDMDDLVNLKKAATEQPLWVLPLYSLLSSEKQQRIFEPVPDGCRLCVVATNIAETSLTIPHVKYVVDCGRQKTRVYDKITGVSTFVVTYTSKASADQRAGRAGRISAGHCYRLYSSAVYNDIFPDFSQPDILQKPIDDLMLKMRCMGIDRIVNFPFPSPPDTKQLEAAEGRLLVLGALELPTKQSNPPAVTPLGKTISCFPVVPCYGKMIALSRQYELMPYTICIVAALSVQEVFCETAAECQGYLWRGYGQYKLLGDPMVLLRALCACEMIGRVGQLPQFCAANRMRPNALVEARKLRLQLTNDVNMHVPDLNLIVDIKLQPPSEEQARFLRQIILAGLGDKVGRKVPLDEISDKEEQRRLKYAYNCGDMEEPAFIHKSSVLKCTSPKWIVYQEAFEIQHEDGQKMFLRGITAIEPEWLLTYVPHLCNVHEIYEEPPPRYVKKTGRIYCHVKVTFGKTGWELPMSEQEMPKSEKACCYFGMYLLDGLVCPPLAAFKPKLKSSPSSLIKSWSNLNDKVLRFKRALINKGVHSRQLLFDQWKMYPEFLLEEYHDLLYDVPLNNLSSIWPPTGKGK